MSNVTDDELLVLKDLWDRTIRPVDAISDRIEMSDTQVRECLESLAAKSFVQNRKSKKDGKIKWRITPDGEAYIQSYQKPWYERPYGLLLIGLIVAILGGVISGVIVASV